MKVSVVMVVLQILLSWLIEVESIFVFVYYAIVFDILVGLVAFEEMLGTIIEVFQVDSSLV
mgnify:CR=1 FL=1